MINSEGLGGMDITMVMDTDTDTDITMVHLQLMVDTILMTTQQLKTQAFLKIYSKNAKSNQYLHSSF